MNKVKKIQQMLAPEIIYKKWEEFINTILAQHRGN